MDKHQGLKKELADEVDRIIDLVEKNLKVMSLKNNLKAMKFLLESKGKDRGYGRQQIIDMKSESKVKVDLSEFENYIGEEEGKESESSNPESVPEGNKEPGC